MDVKKWAVEHAERLRTKANLTKDDRLFLLLADKPDRTAVDNRSLIALMRIEQAREAMWANRGTLRQNASAVARQARKARDHERFLAAGLMTKAGLLDSTTGRPIWKHATLLGALDAMAKATVTDEQRARWTARGEELLQDRTTTPDALKIG